MAEIKRSIGIEGQAGHPALCVLPEIEKEDEIFEIIWTLQEDGKLTLDQIIQSCTIQECESILTDLTKNGWIDIKGQVVELLKPEFAQLHQTMHRAEERIAARVGNRPGQPVDPTKGTEVDEEITRPD